MNSGPGCGPSRFSHDEVLAGLCAGLLSPRPRGMQSGERVVHDLPDLAQRMSGRDALFKIDVAE